MIKKRKILLEELSVSDSVKQITNEIYTQLLQKLKSIPSKISDRNNCVIKKGSFQYYTIKGKKDSIPDFKVNFVVYYLEDEQEYSYLIKHKIINSGGYTEAEKKCIGVFLSMIGNEPSNDFKSTIMHEVNHIYQISNGQTKNKSLYDEVVKRVNSSNEEDRNIAMLLYFSFQTEQDSFISQYYTYLDANDISSKKAENFIEDDECPYCQFLDYYDYFEDIYQDIDEFKLKRYYGLTKDKLARIINNTEKHFGTKIRKAIYRYIKEKKLREDVKHNYTSVGHPIQIKFLFECYKKGISDFEDDFI